MGTPGPGDDVLVSDEVSFREGSSSMSLSVFDLIRISCDSLQGNRLRSALTTLGVFMGVTAVSATLQVRSISTAVIAEEMQKREAPQVQAMMWSRDGKRLRLEDVDYLKSRLRGVQAIGTMMWVDFSATVIFEQKEGSAEINAVSEEHLQISGRSLLQGRFFSPADFSNYRPVAVIDRFLAEELFGGDNPIGQRIYWNARLYIVVGTVDTKARYQEDEPSGEMLIPMPLYAALTGRHHVGMISIRPERIAAMERLKTQVDNLLNQRYPGANVYVENNITDILEQQKTLDRVSRALLAVGAIALLVGGVGIANITIAAVMERTPEIGLRRAIGATSGDIMFQFILEAAILSLLGGVLAILTVHGVTVVVADRFELPYEFERKTAGLALGSALLVGVGAGFLPAMQASKLDPVQALRSR
jgi:putative ABC transport system permease protein